MSGEYSAKLKACCDVALYSKCAGVMVGVHQVIWMLEGPGVGRCRGLCCKLLHPHVLQMKCSEPP